MRLYSPVLLFQFLTFGIQFYTVQETCIVTVVTDGLNEQAWRDFGRAYATIAKEFLPAADTTIGVYRALILGV
jgi:hypothetical protein